MNLSKQQIDAISNLGLAHMGDCVFEILCRGYLCAKGETTVDRLHRDTIAMVKATAQAKFVDEMLPLLTEEEAGVVRRARNARQTPTKNADAREYHRATALEALDPAEGRDLGIRAGANVIMTNLTPARYRENYNLYPGKVSAVS